MVTPSNSTLDTAFMVDAKYQKYLGNGYYFIYNLNDDGQLTSCKLINADRTKLYCDECNELYQLMISNDVRFFRNFKDFADIFTKHETGEELYLSSVYMQVVESKNGNILLVVINAVKSNHVTIISKLYNINGNALFVIKSNIYTFSKPANEDACIAFFPYYKYYITIHTYSYRTLIINHLHNRTYYEMVECDLGYKNIEYLVLRDPKKNEATVINVNNMKCSILNLDIDSEIVTDDNNIHHIKDPKNDKIYFLNSCYKRRFDVVLVNGAITISCYENNKDVFCGTIEYSEKTTPSFIRSVEKLYEIIHDAVHMKSTDVDCICERIHDSTRILKIKPKFKYLEDDVLEYILCKVETDEMTIMKQKIDELELKLKRISE